MYEERRIGLILTVLNLKYTWYLHRHDFPSNDVIPRKLLRQNSQYNMRRRKEGMVVV